MGRRARLPHGRRLVSDLVRVARKMPLASMARNLDLSELASLRKKVRPQPSWNVLFMKAYSLVCAERPELRSVYVPFPWPHLYVFEENVCCLTIDREYKNELWLLFPRFNKPENKSIIDLQKSENFFRKEPVEYIKQWWLVFFALPRHRARNMGTFGMSLSGFKDTVGAIGSISLGPTTTTLGVDPTPRNGISKLLFTFDHRMLDAKHVYLAIERLYATLKGPIADEMKALSEG
ncbi:MAG: hypothetical protein P8Y93_12805 [Acidobacteriota bacterium]